MSEVARDRLLRWVRTDLGALRPESPSFEELEAAVDGNADPTALELLAERRLADPQLEGEVLALQELREELTRSSRPARRGLAGWLAAAALAFAAFGLWLAERPQAPAGEPSARALSTIDFERPADPRLPAAPEPATDGGFESGALTGWQRTG